MSWQNAPVLRKLTAAQRGGNRGAQLWGVDITGKLYTIYQKTPGGEWSNWMGLEWAPTNHPKGVYELAACQLADGRIRLFIVDLKNELWGVEEDSPGGNYSHWWHPSKGYWNNAPAAFKKIAATHMAKNPASLADTPGGAMFVGLKEDGRLAVCYNTGTSWSRFRNDWNGASQLIEVTACQQATGRAAVWGIDDKQQLWGCGEGTPGAADFGGWDGPNWQGAPKLRNVAAAHTNNGAIVVGQTHDYEVVTNFQSAGDKWSGWSAPKWANGPRSYELTAAGQNNGHAQIWAVTLRQKLTSIAQNGTGQWPAKWSDEDNDPYPDPPIKDNTNK